MEQLQAAREQYAEQQRIAAVGGAQAARAARRDLTSVAPIVRAYQLRNVELSLATIAAVLAEQGLPDDPAVTVRPAALLTEPAGLIELVQRAQSEANVVLLARSMITSASRTATLVDAGTRSAVTGYVRHVQPPVCSRCAILAGRVYRFSTGFQRHPRCDCLMTPTTQATGRDLITDPDELLRNGQVRGLSRADTEAISEHGAAMGRVVNVRRREAGLTVEGSVLFRGGRLTPEGIFTRTVDRAERQRLLALNGYIL